MSDLWARLLLVLAGVAMIGVALLIGKHRNRPRSRRIANTGMESGVYLFSSTECHECVSARARLDVLLGEGGFVEMRWEDWPDVFQRLAVEAVPSTLLARSDGSGELHPGVPVGVLEHGNP